VFFSTYVVLFKNKIKKEDEKRQINYSEEQILQNARRARISLAVGIAQITFVVYNSVGRRERRRRRRRACLMQ